MRWSKWLVGMLIVVAGLLALNLLRPSGDFQILNEALAQNRGTGGGDYVVAAARTSTSVQLLYVVDTRLKKMIVYGSKRGSRGGFNFIDTKDLTREFPEGCSGQIVLQPFSVEDRAEGMAVIDTVNKKMLVYVSTNFGRLATVATKDLGRDFGG